MFVFHVNIEIFNFLYYRTWVLTRNSMSYWAHAQLGISQHTQHRHDIPNLLGVICPTTSWVWVRECTPTQHVWIQKCAWIHFLFLMSSSSTLVRYFSGPHTGLSVIYFDLIRIILSKVQLKISQGWNYILASSLYKTKKDS
jgi:hypothetical protein